MDIFKFDHKDNKVRKRWLLSTILWTVGVPFFWLLVGVVCKVNGNEIYELSTGLFGSLVSFYVIRHCAYKKHGNALLTWWLIISPLTSLRNIVDLWQEKYYFLIIVVICIELPLYIWWYRNSINLRRVNRKIEPHLKELKEYLCDVRPLKKVKNISELNTSYDSIVEKWPDLKQTSLEEYNIAKTKLSKDAEGLNICSKGIITKGMEYLKKMTKDSKGIECGLYRFGFVISVIFSSCVLIVGTIAAISDRSVSIMGITLTLAVIIFIIPIVFFKAVGWVIEGFKKT